MLKNKLTNYGLILASISLLVMPAAKAEDCDNFTNTPPEAIVCSILPADMASNISQNTNIIITFDEPVNMSSNGDSVLVDCSISGEQAYPPGPGTTTFNTPVVEIDFNDFVINDVCTITVSGFWIHDNGDGLHLDGNNDGQVAGDFVSSFTVGAGTGAELIFMDSFE